jgi:hypothetical protein
MNRDRHRLQPPEQAKQLPAPAAQATRGPAAWMLTAAVAAGVLSGVAVAWVAMRPAKRSGQQADAALAAGEPVIGLRSAYQRPPAPIRSEQGRPGSSDRRRVPAASADSPPGDARQASVSEEHGDEAPGVEGPPASRDEVDPKATADQEAAHPAEAIERRQQAFQDFLLVGKAVSLPSLGAGGGADLGDGPQPSGERSVAIHLGSFAMADLVDPGFRLAVPRDTVDGKEFRADIVKVDRPGDPTWEIRYLGTAVEVDGGGEGAKPRRLASLVDRAGRLQLEVSRSEPNNSPFALLRRSVILAEAKDPAAPEAPAVVQEIRLVEPTKVRPLVIDLFAQQRQELKIVPPAGIPRTVKAADGSNPPLAIPIASVRLEAELPGGKKVSQELPKDVAEGSQPGIDTWTVPLAQLAPELAIGAEIKLSLPQATVAVDTQLTGNESRRFQKEKIKEKFIDKPDEVLKNFERGFKSRVKTGEAFSFAQKNKSGGATNIINWFGQDLVDQAMGMPDHARIGNSFNLFLKERYQDAARALPPDKRPDLPQDWDGFFKRCQGVTDEAEWQRVFTNTISAWGAWFWPKFKDQFQANVKLFQGALAEQHEIRITAITSLAYDESGNVYEVPLVAGEPGERPAPELELQDEQEAGPGLEGGSRPGRGPTNPPRAEGGGGSVGLD